MFWAIPAFLMGALLWVAKLVKPLPEGVYGPPHQINGEALDTLARTIWGEARGEGVNGMTCVANVIMNRYRIAQTNSSYASRFGKTIVEICKKKYQFSCWLTSDPNYRLLLAVTQADREFATALAIAEKAMTYQLADLTGGAVYYHTRAITPSWVVASGSPAPVKTVGAHKFYTASQIA